MTPPPTFCCLLKYGAYQLYAPTDIPGVDVGERRAICRWNLPPRGWYLDGIVPNHSNCIDTLFRRVRIVPNHSNCIDTLFRLVNCLWEFFFVDFTDAHISLSHTVHKRKIYDTCKRYVGWGDGT